MSSLNVSLETQTNLKLNKSLNAGLSESKKARTAKMVAPLKVGGENSIVSGIGSQQARKSRQTKEGIESTESRKKINAVTGETPIGSNRKITKSLKKKTDKAKLQVQDQSEIFGDLEAKESSRKLSNLSKAKRVLKKKSSGESKDGNHLSNSSPGKSVNIKSNETSTTNVGNEVAGNLKALSKSKLKKKGTGKLPFESKRKKTSGTKTVKLMTKEFRGNDLWSDEISEKSSNTIFNFPPNVQNVKADAQAYRTKVDLAGFSSDKISIDLSGRRLVVIAYRLAAKSSNARKITEVVDIPTNVDLDTLHISRSSDGSLVIEEVIPSLEGQIPV